MGKLKKCSKCSRLHPIGAFSKAASAKDGLRSQCKKCQNASHKKWHLANYPKVRAAKIRKAADWYRNNKDRKRAYDLANRSKTNDKRRSRRAKDPKKFRDALAEWVFRNPEKHKAHVIRYRGNNRALINIRAKERYKIDPKQRVYQSIARSFLLDTYIKSLIVDGTRIKSRDVPQQLIEAKREHLKVYRLIKEKSK